MTGELDYLRGEVGLGTTFCNLGQRTIYGSILNIIKKVFVRIADFLGIKDELIRKRIYNIDIVLAGGGGVIPYLFLRNRFMWKDDMADIAFEKYVRIINRLYKSPQLEIEIKES